MNNEDETRICAKCQLECYRSHSTEPRVTAHWLIFFPLFRMIGSVNPRIFML